MPKLSIIIPVYNKERYITECINSVLEQTFTDFELILVNDGSTDNSGQLCRQFAQNDSRIIAIDQRNGGVSAARNTGLDRATGEYIGFVDSDDTIEPDMYELLINNAVNADADISVCRLQVLMPAKKIAPEEKPGAEVMDHIQAVTACLRGDLDRSANNKIYQSAILKDIRFEGHIYEDILFTCKAFLAAQKTVFENVIKYNYLVRENSTSMGAFNPRYLETVRVSDKIIELVREKAPAALVEAQKFDILANISLLNLLLLLPDKDVYAGEYQQVVERLKSYRSFINNTRGMVAKQKIAFKLFSLSPWLYTWLMYLYCLVTRADVVKRTKTASNIA